MQCQRVRAYVSVLLIVLGSLGVWAMSSWDSRSLYAQSGNAWRIDYFPNANWSGAPLYTDFSNMVNFNWGDASPGPRLPSQNWSARISSESFFYAGIYRFTIVADDEFTLYINGQNYFSTVATGQAGKAIVLDLGMPQGINSLRLDYRQLDGTGYINMRWEHIKQAIVAPPVSPLPAPALGTPGSVVTRFGDYTRCIQQNLHQADCFAADGAWDAPTLGMIRLERQILVWTQCVAGRIETRPLAEGQPPQVVRCSLTEAGFFPN
jgi:hypothetical protein